MKYCLVHCYSDNNKGDLAILLGTIEAIRCVDKDANIVAISTYNHDDPMYISEHSILSKHVDAMLPAFFGILNRRNKPGQEARYLEKAILNIRDGIRFFLYLKFGRTSLSSLLIRNSEKRSISEMLSSDVVISKGGSFICNENTWRDKISLFRILYPLILCHSRQVEYYIVGQSIGPVYGGMCIRKTNEVLENAKRVFLRETKCIEQFPSLSLRGRNVTLGRDCAFMMESYENVELPVMEGSFNVGVTVKYTEDDTKFDSMIISGVKYLIEKFNANIYFITHVHIDNDGAKSKELYEQMPTEFRKNVRIIDENYNVAQLRNIYKQMHFNICTRLHSAIFSLSTNTPVICIAYHGTKAQGVFELIGLEKFVISQSEYTEAHLLGLIEEILTCNSQIRDRLNEEIPKTKKVIIDMFEEIRKATLQ